MGLPKGIHGDHVGGTTPAKMVSWLVLIVRQVGEQRLKTMKRC